MNWAEPDQKDWIILRQLAERSFTDVLLEAIKGFGFGGELLDRIPIPMGVEVIRFGDRASTAAVECLTIGAAV